MEAGRVPASIFFGGLELFTTFAVPNRPARMAESVDALVSGTSKRKFVQVRVLFRAHQKSIAQRCFFGVRRTAYCRILVTFVGYLNNFGRDMEISLFAKCIRELIVEHDRVDVPYLGTFTAEMMPATYSDRQTTIHPPYRKMSFHKGAVALSEGRLLLDKVRREAGVSLEQAGVELGWCLSRLSSELEGRKICRLPGLGVMRANARNEFFFVPDDNLDIWPDGVGFEAISIKVSEKPAEVSEEVSLEESEPIIEMPGQARHDEGEDAREAADGISSSEHFSCERDEIPEQPRARKRLHPVWIVLIVLGVLLLLFVAACYLFTDQLSPIIDPLLYNKEELELLRGM